MPSRISCIVSCNRHMYPEKIGCPCWLGLVALLILSFYALLNIIWNFLIYLNPYWIVNLIENCSKLLRRSDSSLVSFRLADYAFCHNFPCAWLVLVHRFYLKQQKKCCRRHWYIRTAECLTSYCTLSTKSVAFLNVFFLIY